MLRILHQPISSEPRQVIEVPEYSKFLSVSLHPHLNFPMLWLLAESESEHKPEKVEIIRLCNEEELKPVTAKFIGTYRDNSGDKFFFVSRTTDHPFTKIPHE